MMKNILLFMSIALLFSCSNDETDNTGAEVIGTWKLIEVWASPGGGAINFRPVESSKTIEFKTNGVITTNSSLCDPYSEEIKSSGTYSLTNNKITTKCQNPNIATISFEIKDNHLLLHFLSNEGYSQKFERIN